MAQDGPDLFTQIASKSQEHSPAGANSESYLCYTDSDDVISVCIASSALDAGRPFTIKNQEGFLKVKMTVDFLSEDKLQNS